MFGIKRKLKSALATSLRNRGRYGDLNADKMELLDYASRRLKVRSFADLGGVWRVDAGYTFYTLEKYGVDKAFLVDTDFTENVKRRTAEFPELTLIQGNFGDEKVAKQIGTVDAAIFFDTLVHQVRPDWNEVLTMYAVQARVLIIYNPQFNLTAKTVRLLDLGEKQYFENVPAKRTEEPYKTVFDNPTGIHPQHGRPNSDIHNIWQWGITDADLIATMTSLGFSLHFYRNCGRFGNLRNFENHAFIFLRRGDAA